MELLAVLTRDHRDLDGNYESLDIDALLHHNQYCKDTLEHYLTRKDAEELARTVAALREQKEGEQARTDNRAKTWEDLQPSYRIVPLQEEDAQLVTDYHAEIGDEHGAMLLDLEEAEEDEGDVRVVRDPLGLSELDISATQELHVAGKLTLNLYGKEEWPRRGGSEEEAPAAGTGVSL